MQLIGTPGHPYHTPEAREVALRAYAIAHDPNAFPRQLAAIRASGDRRSAEPASALSRTYVRTSC
jgi:hypothetical protein